MKIGLLIFGFLSISFFGYHHFILKENDFWDGVSFAWGFSMLIEALGIFELQAREKKNK